MSNKSFSIKENPYMKDIQGGEKKVMKKILSVALSTAMAFSMFASVAFGADAEKLTPEQQFNVLKEAGIFTGYPDGLSHLERGLTRAELAKIIVKSMSLEEVPGVASYKDKNYTAKHWAAPFIEAATNAKIMEGVSTNPANPLFNPTGSVTVEQLAKVLVEANKLEIPAETNNTASAWAKGYVEAAVKAGYIEAGINYQANATRSQAVVASHAIYEFNNFKVTKADAKDATHVTLTLSTGEVVEVTLEKALEANKETKLTYKAADGRELPYSVTWVVTDATKVESASANNLKEITVKFDGDVKKEDAEKVTNYKIDGVTLTNNAVITLQEDGTSVVINLGKEGTTLTNQKKHQLTVSGINKIATTSVDFTALDVTVPEVTDVQILGNKVINVKFSEPVKTASATTRVNYKVNGFVVNGELELSKDSKTATITLYSRLKSGVNKLSVSGVQDYANMTIINVLDKEITVVEDATAPESFTIESATLDSVTVKFNEAVDASTVKADKIYWSDNAGTVKTTASSVKATDSTFTTYEITFGEGKKLPARETTLYIESASDLFGNTAAKLSSAVNATVDVTRPEISSLVPSTDATGNYTTASASSFDVKFNKSIATSQFTGSNTENLVVKDKDGKVVAVASSAAEKKDNKNTLTVGLSTVLKEGSTYTVEVKNVVDGTALNNKMIPQTFTVTIPEVTQPTVTNVAVIDAGNAGTRIQVVYSNAMSLDGEYSVLKADRYMIKIGTSWRLLPVGTTFEPTFDSKAVIVTIPADATYDGVNKITAANVAGFKVTLVADKNANKLKELTKEVVVGNAEWGAQVASIITTGDDAAVATANDKVKLYYNRPLQVVYASDFTVNGTQPASATHENIDGKGVVTLTLNSSNKLAAAAVTNVVVASNSRTLDLLGNSVKAETISARDGIAPTIVSSPGNTGINVVSSNKFEVVLSEDLYSPLPQTSYSAMFVVKTGLAQDKTLTPEQDYTVAINGNKLVFTATGNLTLTNAQKITVATNDAAMYIFDDNASNGTDVSKASKVKFGTTEVGGVSNFGVSTGLATLAARTVAATDAVGASNDGKVNVSWNALTATQISDSGATGFAVEVLNGTTLVQTVSVSGATSTSTLISGLTAGTAYNFNVYAVNGAARSTAGTATATPVNHVAGTASVLTSASAVDPTATLTGTDATLTVTFDGATFTTANVLSKWNALSAAEKTASNLASLIGEATGLAGTLSQHVDVTVVGNKIVLTSKTAGNKALAFTTIAGTNATEFTALTGIAGTETVVAGTNGSN